MIYLFPYGGEKVKSTRYDVYLAAPKDYANLEGGLIYCSVLIPIVD